MVNDTVDSTLDNGAWLTLAEAAPLLGVSEKTVRRRVKAGQVKGRQVPTQHGRAWQVWVPNRVDTVGMVDSAGTQSSTQVSTPAQPLDVAALVALVDRLTTENGELIRTVAAWQSQAVVLAGRLADAQERLAIAAPAVSPVAAQQAPDVPPTASVPPAVRDAPGTVEAPSEPPDMPLRLWQPWWAILMAMAVAIVVVVALLAWP